MPAERVIFTIPASVRKLMKKHKRNWSAFVSAAIAKELNCEHKPSLEERVAALERLAQTKGA